MIQLSVYQEMKKEMITLNKQFDKFAENINKLMRITVKQNGHLIEHAKKLKTVGRATKETAEQTKKATETEKALNSQYKTRTEILDLALKKLGENGEKAKKFEITSKKARDAYRTEGGNVFDFIDLALTSANQRIKIFGVEAALARKVMYGFLPPGMFRLVNKLSTAFRFLGGIFRKTGKDGENIDNIFKKMARGLLSFPSFDKAVTQPFKFLTDKKQTGRSRKMAQGTASIFEGNMLEESKQKNGLKDKLTIFKKEAKQRRDARKAAIKGFFKSKKWVEVGSVVAKFGKGVLANLGKFLFMAMLYMVLITVAIAMLRKPIMKGIQLAGDFAAKVLPSIMQGVGFVFEGIKQIYDSMLGGDLLGIIEGFWTLAWGLIQVAISVVVALGMGLLGTLLGLAYGALEMAGGFVRDLFTGVGGITGILKRIAVIAVLVGAFLYGFPFVVGAIILTAIGVLLKKLGEKIGIFSSGGTVTTGMQLVGEKGPELVSLPRGSRVHSNNDSKNIARNAKGGVVNNYNITINAKDTSKAEMRRVADEIGRMVSSKINRRTSHRSSV